MICHFKNCEDGSLRKRPDSNHQGRKTTTKEHYISIFGVFYYFKIHIYYRSCFLSRLHFKMYAQINKDLETLLETECKNLVSCKINPGKSLVSIVYQ